MGLKSAKQGSHLTLQPLLSNTGTNITFRRGGEGRRFGPSQGGWGRAPKVRWLEIN